MNNTICFVCKLQGNFLWPGFGDNVRVLDWILRRVDGDQIDSAVETPIGYIPTEKTFNVEGLDKINWEELFSLPKDFWMNELTAIEKYFSDNIGSDLPPNLTTQIEQIRRRFNKTN
jgi:phosphoenolpyruvate carboxykinase (GTP)